jgi:hypothetical protein
MNTDWFHKAKWGVFVHYGPHRGRENWNAQIDAFDAEGLARQLPEARAGYFFFTVGHGHGMLSAPNETYDRILELPADESRCSRRDLISDIADALEPHGIRMMVYLPACAPGGDPYAVKKLKWIDGQTLGWDIEGNRIRVGRRPVEFMRHWEAVIREFSLRWGKKVHGWWLDGCYWPEHIYRHADEPNYKSLAEAIKAGNAEALVAFNGGLETPVIGHSEYEDFTAGEIGHLLPVSNRRLNGALVPLRRFIDGVQYHILTHLGTHWGRTPARFPVELVIGYTKLINAHDGVITWDAGLDEGGNFQPDHFEQLKALGDATRQHGRTEPLECPPAVL